MGERKASAVFAMSPKFGQTFSFFSHGACAVYGTIPNSIPVEWVAQEDFRMKEMMDTTLEDEGKTPVPWYQVILDFLRTGVLPKDPLVANKIQRQSLRYITLDGVVYRRSFPGSPAEIRHPRGRADGRRRDAWGHVWKSH
ncbi:hypothetical protein LIER_38651 [Lithospermum erythrorhizon]|uniref:Uncharacterized protein n=1 Tax=Lithospermum erythrorhizon TaxID=34254 RepID=A0AAV3Q306_LITER